MEQIQGALLNLLIVVVCGAITIATAYIKKYTTSLVEKSKVETSKITDEKTRILVDNAIDRLNILVQENVQSAQLTIVKEVKEASSDGKIDKTEGANILSEVRYNILKQLSEDSKALISAEIGDLNSYIETLIETTLGEIKGQI